MTSPVVGIIMGSQTDWSTMKKTADILTEFNISFETKIDPITDCSASILLGSSFASFCTKLNVFTIRLVN